MVAKAIVNADMSGRYTFPALPPLHALHMLIAVALGIVGAILSFIEIFILKCGKLVIHKFKLDKRPIITFTLGAFIFGWAAVLYPQTLFWSENEIQTIIDRGATPLPSTVVPGILHVAVPYNTANLAGIGVLKFFTIVVTVVSGFPGGIIFPLYFAGMALGHVVSDLIPFISPSLSMLCLAASIQVSLLRTPWATSIILVNLNAIIMTAPNDIFAVFPGMLLASYTALFLTRKYHYYPSALQHSRQDLIDPDANVVGLPEMEDEGVSQDGYDSKPDEKPDREMNEDQATKLIDENDSKL